jgi:hypothetical protein
MRNLNAPTIGAARERIPQQFSAGLAYKPIPSMNILADYRKETGFDASPRLGFEYWMIEWVALRCGVSGEPSRSSGGMGFRFSFVRIDYALSHHQDLGWSHQGSLTLQW